MADDQPRAKRKPRLGIIIRVAIYVPLLGFFGWRAWERFAAERDAADEVFRERVNAWLEHPPQTIMLPNGEALPMLTPEQAEAQGYQLPDSFNENDSGADRRVDGGAAERAGGGGPREAGGGTGDGSSIK